MTRVSTVDPKAVDRVFGKGFYGTWMTVLDAFIDEQTRAFANQQRYPNSAAWAAPMRTQLDADLAVAEKAVDDYIEFLEQNSASSEPDFKPNFKTGESILAVLVMAISVLQCVNDILDEMFDLGIITLFTSLAGTRLEIDAKAVENSIKRLKEALERAKREVKEAYAQTALNAAIAGVLLAVGPVGWVTLGAVGVAQVVADSYLGPNTSDPATWGSRSNTGISTAAGAAEKYVIETSKVTKVAKVAGKATIVVGFVFDVNEVLLGYRNVDEIKRLMADAKKAHEALLAKIKIHKSLLDSLLSKLKKLREELEKDSGSWCWQTRATLEAEITRTGYRPRP